VVDMGNHRDAVGLINGSRVSVRVPADFIPVSGAAIPVGARSGVHLR
jgi:hypothetical protein